MKSEKCKVEMQNYPALAGSRNILIARRENFALINVIPASPAGKR